MPMLEHGGRLRQAAAEYAIPLGDWLDLSTGVNPLGWTAPTIPPACWARLPEEGDGLEEAAQAYYGVSPLLPIAGSQAAIQALPLLRQTSTVGLIHPAYAEHLHAWHRAGHQTLSLDEQDIDHYLPQLDVLVVIRPNNPTGSCPSLPQLLAWHAQLAQCGGWLVVDEAFTDTTPEITLLAHSRPGLIILRSLGKFFGLAGARVGFIHAQTEILAQLAEQLGPWNISGPARWIATKALQDHNWQTKARLWLAKQETRLNSLLSQNGLFPTGGCALFQWVTSPHAAAFHQSLARQAILTRLYREPLSLRFGLPGSEAAWERLAKALSKLEASG
jgi:cobalamin biosynthesis protein CobC